MFEKEEKNGDYSNILSEFMWTSLSRRRLFLLHLEPDNSLLDSFLLTPWKTRSKPFVQIFLLLSVCNFVYQGKSTTSSNDWNTLYRFLQFGWESHMTNGSRLQLRQQLVVCTRLQLVEAQLVAFSRKFLFSLLLYIYCFCQWRLCSSIRADTLPIVLLCGQIIDPHGPSHVSRKVFLSFVLLCCCCCCLLLWRKEFLWNWLGGHRCDLTYSLKLDVEWQSNDRKRRKSLKFESIWTYLSVFTLVWSLVDIQALRTSEDFFIAFIHSFI